MPKIVFDDFRKGLWIEGRADSMPQATARRFKGIHKTTLSSVRSRNGSTLITALDSHSLFRFNDTRFQGSGTVFYQAGTSKQTGLDGSRLAFVRMPPTLAKVDQLFCSGGGNLFKIDSSGVVSQWGIDAPSTAPAVATGAAGVLTGDYLYKVTFRNSSTETISNAGTASSTVAPSSEQVDLSDIPISADSQVDSRQIYRTVAGGAVYFLQSTIADNTTTILTDNTKDSSLSTELRTDNDPPLDTYEDCEGPHVGRMWWARNTVTGAKGRIYHSPSGRAEAVESFIDVTDDDDPTQKNVSWNGHLYTFTESSVYEIIGTGANGVFTPRLTPAEAGTIQPESVAKSDSGIFYVAPDGIRVFDGVRSKLIGFESIARLLQGETADDFAAAFAGAVGTFTGSEYMVSDGSNTIAYDINSGRWRNMGIGCNALFYEKDTRQIQASFNSEAVVLEDEGTTDDNGSAISFSLETPEATSGTADEAVVKRVIVDIEANSQAITVTIILDGIESTLKNITGSGRQQVEFPIGKSAKRVALRLTASLSARIEIFSITFDTHLAPEAVAP